MLLTVVILGSIFLSASAIGGLLTLYQVKQANDAAVAAQAVFAADAGIEWQIFCYFVGQTKDVPCPAGSSSLKNGASFTSEAILNRSAGKLTITAEGSAGLGSRKIVRALETIFTFSK